MNVNEREVAKPISVFFHRAVVNEIESKNISDSSAQ
jgi:hypothetical protein